MSFDDYLARAHQDTDPPEPHPTPVREQTKWEHTTINTDTKHEAKVMQRMSRRGWEYVSRAKNPIFSMRKPHALTFRRQA